MRPKPLMATRVGMEVSLVRKAGRTTAGRGPLHAIRTLCVLAMRSSTTAANIVRAGPPSATAAVEEGAILAPE